MKQQQRSCRILVCAPSHTASDVITRRLGQHLGTKQLFRLCDSNRPIETVPISILQFCRQNTEQGGFELPPVQELYSKQVIVCTCSDAHILYSVGLTNHQLRVRRSCFAGYLKQACEVGNLTVDLQGHTAPHFSHLFVDEAAQATEPELLIPLSVVADPYPCITSNKVEIALVGDPRQLSPAVYSPHAAAAGLERSLMERLLQRPIQCLGSGHEHMLGPTLVEMGEWLAYSFRKDGQEQLSVFLTQNYRCHPSILAMPSALFYFDKLLSVGAADRKGENGESFWCEKLRCIEGRSKPVRVAPIPNGTSVPAVVQFKKQSTWPIHCYCVEGTDKSLNIKSGFPSSTWSNEEEARKLVEIVAMLTKQGVKSADIGVMAPFRGQVVLIRQYLRAQGLSAVNVGTIEDFQAVECHVCLISLTRATPSFVKVDIFRRVGVFGQPKRSNVALTRAENLLIVVGCATVMSDDPIWRQFLLFCIRNGLLYGDPGKDLSILQEWDHSNKLVKSFDEPGCIVETTNDGGEITVPSLVAGEIQRVVVVGTLERVLRTSSW
jgi:hypothetical protein